MSLAVAMSHYTYYLYLVPRGGIDFTRPEIEMERGLFMEVEDHINIPLSVIYSLILTELMDQEKREEAIAYLRDKAYILVRNENVTHGYLVLNQIVDKFIYCNIEKALLRWLMMGPPADKDLDTH